MTSAQFDLLPHAALPSPIRDGRNRLQLLWDHRTSTGWEVVRIRQGYFPAGIARTLLGKKGNREVVIEIYFEPFEDDEPDTILDFNAGGWRQKEERGK